MNKPKRILVVDDEGKIREVLRKFLESLGHEVETAQDGIDALAKLKPDIDLVLLDLKMPRMDGFEATQQIRENPEYQDLPIIMITGFVSREDRLRAVEVGVDDFIAKPLDFTELRMRTKSLLHKKEVQDELKRYSEKLEETVKERTSELLESKERFRIVSEITSDFAYAYRVEPDGELILDWVTGSLERLTGYNPEEIEQKGGWESLIHPDDLDENRRKFQTLMSGETTVVDYRISRKDGEISWMSDFGRPEYDEKLGRVTHIYGAVKNITQRKRAEEELKKSREQLSNLTAHIQAAREQERTMIAREIHDELAQTLTVLNMDLSWLTSRLNKGQKALLQKTESMKQHVESIIMTVKRIYTELRPFILDELGLSAAIEWYTEEFQERSGIKCKLSIEPEEIILDSDRSTAVFRIFQEMLTNIARHAKATSVNISLKIMNGTIVLQVKDNGRGITQEQASDSKSFGLLGIRERASYFGGEVVIKGVRNKGTTVTVTIPLHNEGES